MYRKYYNSSYYIAKTQENSPVRQENGNYINQPLIDQTNLQQNQQLNSNNIKVSRQGSSNQQINLKSLVQNQIALLQQQNIGNITEYGVGDKQNSFIKRYNSSQKRVKTQNNTPEKFIQIRAQRNNQNNSQEQRQESNQLINNSLTQSNQRGFDEKEIKQGNFSGFYPQHLRARSNNSMQIQKMSIQKLNDTLKIHRGAQVSQNTQQTAQEQYQNLNKLILKDNQSFNFNNHLLTEQNQPIAVINNQNIYIKRKEQQEQKQGDQIRSQHQKINSSNKTINSQANEQETVNQQNTSNQFEEQIKSTIEKEAKYYLQDRFNENSRKNTPSINEKLRHLHPDESSQYNLDKINKREETQQNKRQKSGLKPPQGQERVSRVSEKQFNMIKNKIPIYSKNLDNILNTRQTNSSLSTYTPHDGSTEDKTIDITNYKSNMPQKTESAQLNNYFDIPFNQSSKEKQKQNGFNNNNNSSNLEELQNQLFGNNYKMQDQLRRKSISPFERRIVKKQAENSINKVSLNNSISQLEKSCQEDFSGNPILFTTIQNDYQFYQNYKSQENINQGQNISKEKLKKMQLSFLNSNNSSNNNTDNPINNICNLLKKNKQLIARNNKNADPSDIQNKSNLLKVSNINQQHVNNLMHRISKRSQSYANAIPNKIVGTNNRNNITPEQRRASQNELPTNNSFKMSLDCAQDVPSKEEPIKIRQAINVVKLKKIDIIHSFRTKKGVMASNPKKQNQDSFFMSEKMSNKDYDQIYFLGVMDGHGTNGHLVSQFIKNNIIEEYKQQGDEINYAQKLINLTDSLNTKLANSSIDCMFSGTTMISLLLLMNQNSLKIFSCNCGDSRAIMGLLKSQTVTQQTKGKQNSSINSYFFEVLELSRDHKPELPDEKERILQQNGRIDSYRDEYGNQLGPMRVWLKNENIPGLAMSRSIGDDVATSVGVTWEPEIKEFDIQFISINSQSKQNEKITENQDISQNQKKENFDSQDTSSQDCNSLENNHRQNITADSGFLIIGSDGVWEFLPNEEIIKEIGKYYILKDIEGACSWLLNEAYHKWTCEDDSVVDDITFIIIFFQPKEIIQKTISTKQASQSLDFDK
ncbi:protein phosphatase 2c (macronuclear) [Tetrahymena thermophila SB210]|uniref:Protein phosphatase 2c n=1 Tax=Tetrahymena thermophila (strain SB210) TaxID=312017 RepID=I7M3I6_TETTS|nr:protein phosphatase 2c [Tetrahymena thermophila SB210]EAS03218.2 protein phosphatase 2c [Tetrahymena thermophila SB210]|eukprot:XP_001023463.2 protein phosphatase 2c [Tetrahymena thermophila SB210]